MKTLVLTLVFAMMLMSAPALKCNKCVPLGPGGKCTTIVETCTYKKDACISARLIIHPYAYFRRCISMPECLLLQANQNINVRCCQSDLCN